MSDESHLVVKDWEKHQHYKQKAKDPDYRPSWIKLYTDVMTDPSIACLDPSSRWCLVGLWILAARTGNRIPENYAWLDRMVGMDTEKAVAEILEHGLVVRYSGDSRDGLDESYTESRGSLDIEKRREDKKREEGEAPREGTLAFEVGKLRDLGMKESELTTLLARYGTDAFQGDIAKVPPDDRESIMVDVLSSHRIERPTRVPVIALLDKIVANRVRAYKDRKAARQSSSFGGVIRDGR